LYFTGAAARRNKDLETATPMTATRTRYHHGSACIFTSSSSSQIYGSSELSLLASSRRQKRRRVQAVGVVRCEQAKDGGANNSLDIWLGRVAMLGFVAAVGVEIVTGKGVLEVLSFSSLCLLICGRAPIVCTYIKDLKCSSSFKQIVD
jgi:hypothetical protein